VHGIDYNEKYLFKEVLWSFQLSRT
jgi:hypothetical protein